jgi:hypothetical protein
LAEGAGVVQVPKMHGWTVLGLDLGISRGESLRSRGTKTYSRDPPSSTRPDSGGQALRSQRKACEKARQGAEIGSAAETLQDRTIGLVKEVYPRANQAEKRRQNYCDQESLSPAFSRKPRDHERDADAQRRRQYCSDDNVRGKQAVALREIQEHNNPVGTQTDHRAVDDKQPVDPPEHSQPRERESQREVCNYEDSASPCPAVFRVEKAFEEQKKSAQPNQQNDYAVNRVSEPTGRRASRSVFLNRTPSFPVVWHCLDIFIQRGFASINSISSAGDQGPAGSSDNCAINCARLYLETIIPRRSMRNTSVSSQQRAKAQHVSQRPMRRRQLSNPAPRRRDSGGEEAADADHILPKNANRPRFVRVGNRGMRKRWAVGSTC